MTHPHTLLFDWDNTLADSWGVIHASLNRTFVAMGKSPWSIEDVQSGREGIHQSLRNSFPRLFGDAWEEARAHYYRFFREVHLDQITLLNGCKAMLDALQERGYNLAIVSNKTGDYLREEVQHLGVADYFSAVVGATDAKEDKPHATPLFHALSLADIAHDASSDIPFNHAIWMVGDSATDVEAALNAGCFPVIYGMGVDKQAYANDARLHAEGMARVTSHEQLVQLLNHKRDAR